MTPASVKSDFTLFVPQACRGLACLMVAWFHGTTLVERWYGLKPLSVVYNFGYAGVHLFFVISGLIIYHAHQRDTGNPANIPAYWLKRLVRIYPLYWIVFMVWGGWKVFAGKLGVADFFSNALLFSSSKSLVVPVSWSLAFEMVFYLLFTVFIASRRLGFAVFAAWFALVGLNHVFPFSGMMAFSLANLLFVFGLGASALLMRLKQSLGAGWRDGLGLASLAAGVALFAATSAYWQRSSGGVESVYVWNNAGATLGFGLGSALILLASLSVRIERFLRQRNLVLLIGNASYSIYLVHFYIQRIAFNATRPVDFIWSAKSEALADGLLVFVVLVSVAAGVIIHLWIEKPVLTWLRRHLKAGGLIKRG